MTDSRVTGGEQVSMHCPKCHGMAFIHRPKPVSQPALWTCEWCFHDWRVV